jgi:hypothetical protein
MNIDRFHCTNCGNTENQSITPVFVVRPQTAAVKLSFEGFLHVPFAFKSTAWKHKYVVPQNTRTVFAQAQTIFHLLPMLEADPSAIHQECSERQSQKANKQTHPPLGKKG